MQTVHVASTPTSYTPGLRKVNREIAELDFPVQELTAQWAMFQKDCPDPTTDESCLDAKSKIMQSMQKVYESRLLLLDQKISLLETGPQDSYAKQQVEESTKNREQLKTALQKIPVVLASLDRSLEQLKNAKEDR